MGLSLEEKRRRAEKTKDLKAFVPADNQNYVFISYASDNWELVLNSIVKTLVEKYGLRVYFDKNFDIDNEFWVKNMRSAILTNKCKAILAFVSKEYMKSYACLMELMTARSLLSETKHDHKRLDIIPIVINAESIDETKSESSIDVNISEKKEFNEIFKSFKKSKSVKDNENLKSVIEILSNGDIITEEDVSVSVENILKDKSHVRIFHDSDVFYKNLNDAINKISEVFSEELKKMDSKSTQAKKIVVEPVYSEPVVEPAPSETVPKSEQTTATTSNDEAEETSIPKEVSVNDEMLYFNGAFGISNGMGGIIVKAGSRVSKEESSTCPEGSSKMRAEAFDAGDLIDKDSYYELKSDKEFKSLSGASCFVSGYSISGKIAWTNVEKKQNKSTGKPRLVGDNSQISSRINQILMVVSKVKNMPGPIYDYGKVINDAAKEASEELNITKSAVTDKCQRQLGLTADEFYGMLRNHIVNGDNELFKIVFDKAKTEAEKTAVKEAFGKI